MKFNASLNIDPTKWSQVRMVRENNKKDFRGHDEEMPKFGAGSEFGREQVSDVVSDAATDANVVVLAARGGAQEEVRLLRQEVQPGLAALAHAHREQEGGEAVQGHQGGRGGGQHRLLRLHPRAGATG
jgi:hypothetical protein